MKLGPRIIDFKFDTVTHLLNQSKQHRECLNSFDTTTSDGVGWFMFHSINVDGDNSQFFKEYL